MLLACKAHARPTVLRPPGAASRDGPSMWKVEDTAASGLGARRPSSDDASPSGRAAGPDPGPEPRHPPRASAPPAVPAQAPSSSANPAIPSGRIRWWTQVPSFRLATNPASRSRFR